jgi:hypothetical protein
MIAATTGLGPQSNSSASQAVLANENGFYGVRGLGLVLALTYSSVVWIAAGLLMHIL